MTERPDRIFGATSIRDKCGECDERPVSVATYPEDPKTMLVAWACDEHLPRLAAFAGDQGVDHKQHIFESTRTCLATGSDGTPCGAAGDFLVVQIGGRHVMTICRRHLEEWRPQAEVRDRADWW
jgi:hypothetical protein